jgi:ubiquinone/menaquinone biosynthesis C-methylase UbiE
MAGHKYDAGKYRGLANIVRALVMPRTEILDLMTARKEEDWADIGCGLGVHTLSLARSVRKVYGLDINENTISMLRKIVDAEGLLNIDLRISKENFIPLKDSCVDGVLLAFVVHELDDPDEFFQEVGRILNDRGRLYVVEFIKQKYSFSPPPSHLVKKNQVDKWADEAGLRPDRSLSWARKFLGWRYLQFGAWEYRKG